MEAIGEEVPTVGEEVPTVGEEVPTVGEEDNTVPIPEFLGLVVVTDGTVVEGIDKELLERRDTEPVLA